MKKKRHPSGFHLVTHAVCTILDIGEEEEPLFVIDAWLYFGKPEEDAEPLSILLAPPFSTHGEAFEWLYRCGPIFPGMSSGVDVRDRQNKLLHTYDLNAVMVASDLPTMLQ